MSEGETILMDAMSQIGTAAAAEDELNFDEAFLTHHRTVFRVANSVLHDAGLAEDVTQEVFIRLFRNLSSLENRETLRPWLVRVALNLAKNALRGKFRANTREENYVKEKVDASAPSVEMSYEQRERVKEIENALEKIKEPLRSCLILKKQGLSYREIAASLSLNESSIGTFVARARREFVRHFEEGGGQL